MLTSSASELKSVSKVYGRDTRFEVVSDDAGGFGELLKADEFRGERAGEEREIER